MANQVTTLPLKPKTIEMVGTTENNYEKILVSVQLTTIPADKITLTVPKKAVYKTNSLKTIKDFSLVLDPTAKYKNVCIKFIDPVRTSVLDVEGYFELLNFPTPSDMILKYPYPVLKAGQYSYKWVLFKVAAKNRIIEKFEEEEANALIKFSKDVWDSTVTYFNTKDLKNKEICITNMHLSYANASHDLKTFKLHNPVKAGLPLSEFEEMFNGMDDEFAIISVRNDMISLPYVFDSAFAELINTPVDINKELNEAFLKETISLASSGSSTSSDIPRPPPNQLVQPIVYRETNILLHRDVVVGYYTYDKPTYSRVDIYGGLTHAEYFLKYGNKRNRLIGILENFTISPTIDREVDGKLLGLLFVPDADKVKAIMDVIVPLRGENLLKHILMEIKPKMVEEVNIKRYNFEPLGAYFAQINQYYVRKCAKTPQNKVKAGYARLLFCAFEDMSNLLRQVGIHKFASEEEMYCLLSGLDPDNFKDYGTDPKMPLTKTPVQSEIRELVKTLGDLDIADKFKAKSVTASTIMAKATTTSGSILAKSTPASTESGYRSVSTGNRFSQTSSYGDNCVSGQKSVKYTPIIPAMNISQNVLQKGIALVCTNYEHVYEEGGLIKFSTTVFNPQHIRAQARSAVKIGSFTRFYPSHENVVETTVVITEPLKIDTMDIAILDSISAGDNVDTRRFVSALTSNYQFERKLGELICPLLNKCRDRYSNGSLYTVAFMIQFMLTDFENNGIIPQFAVPAENSITVAQTMPAANDMQFMADVIQEAMFSGRISLYGNSLSQKDLAVMKLITLGPSAITTPDNADVEHVGSSIIIRNICKWMVYKNTAVDIAGPIGRITARDVSAFIGKLKDQMRDYDAVVHGFCTAATILNGKIYKMEYKGKEVTRFIMSTLEIGQINLPRVVGHNFLWNLIKLEPRREQATYFKDDFNAITSANETVQNLVSVYTAQWISLGVSTFFDCWNITGIDLNATVLSAPNANNLAQIMDQMITARNGLPAPLLSVAAGLCGQISDVVINPLIFGARHYGNQFNGIRTLDHDNNDLYAGAFGDNNPYLEQPMAFSFAFDAWIDIWYLLAPKVEFEVTQEINMLGPQALRIFDTRLGAKEIDIVATGTTPYVKHSYPGLVLSMLKQHFAPDVDWVISTGIHYAVNGKLNFIVENDYFQPQYDPDFGTIMAGTLQTWSWNLCRTLLPRLKPATIGDSLFHVLAACKTTDMNSSGIYVGHTQIGTPISAGIFTLPTIVGLEAYGTDRIHTATTANSEN